MEFSSMEGKKIESKRTRMHIYTLSLSHRNRNNTMLNSKTLSSFRIQHNRSEEKKSNQKNKRSTAKRYDNHKIDKTKLKETLTCTCCNFQLYQLIVYVMHIRNACSHTNIQIAMATAIKRLFSYSHSLLLSGAFEFYCKIKCWHLPNEKTKGIRLCERPSHTFTQICPNISTSSSNSPGCLLATMIFSLVLCTCRMPFASCILRLFGHSGCCVFVSSISFLCSTFQF